MPLVDDNTPVGTGASARPRAGAGPRPYDTGASADPRAGTGSPLDGDNPEVVFRLAKIDDAPHIVTIYEHVFGKGGIKAPGHEPYPAPDVFTTDGVLRILRNPAKKFVVAVLDGKIVGGMLINFLS